MITRPNPGDPAKSMISRGGKNLSVAEFEAMFESVKNWGRWGPDDELGTLNFITPERVAAACRLATTGKVLALGIPLDRNGPQSGTRARFTPSGRSSSWRSWRRTARPTAATRSCSSRPRCRSAARSARRSIPTR
jgi:hypothetical protein